MTLEEVLQACPKAATYFENMPQKLKSRYTIHKFQPGTMIHQKDYSLDYFGIVCSGSFRVINEFKNGNIFMIEKNEAVDFLGEVAILAEKPVASVSIQTITECIVFMISRSDFEMWIAEDIHLLRLVAHRVACKLYQSSYNRGARLFYPPSILLLDYIVKYAESNQIDRKVEVTLLKTREDIREELGMNVKMINRAVAKLKEEGLIDTRKGKVVLSKEQYHRAKEEIGKYVS